MADPPSASSIVHDLLERGAIGARPRPERVAGDDLAGTGSDVIPEANGEVGGRRGGGDAVQPELRCKGGCHLGAQGPALLLALAPTVLVVMNIVYSATAYPIGTISDRINRRVLLTAGFVALIAADLILALAPNVWFVMLGVVLWGLHMGMTQGCWQRSLRTPHRPHSAGLASVYSTLSAV
jgi:MFS family permease